MQDYSWRPRDWPPCLEDEVEGRPAYSLLEVVGGQDFWVASGGPGPSSDGDDWQDHCSIRPGRRWRPCQEQEGLICEGQLPREIVALKTRKFRPAEVIFVQVFKINQAVIKVVMRVKNQKIIFRTLQIPSNLFRKTACFHIHQTSHPAIHICMRALKINQLVMSQVRLNFVRDIPLFLLSSLWDREET